MAQPTRAGITLSPDQANSRGMLTFLDAYFDAPPDADIEMRAATNASQQHVLVVTLTHAEIAPVTVGMTAAQALGMAQMLEGALQKFPIIGQSAGLRNLIDGLCCAAARMAALDHRHPGGPSRGQYDA